MADGTGTGGLESRGGTGGFFPVTLKLTVRECT